MPKAATPKNAAPAKPAAAVAKPAASPAAALATGKWTVTKQGLKFMDLELGTMMTEQVQHLFSCMFV